MLFADFSALVLLAGTVAATPRHPWRGKWQHFHHHPSFASLEGVSAGVTMPFAATGTAPVIPQGTAPIAASGIVSPIESAGEGESGEEAKAGKVGTPQETPGLLSPSAPAKAPAASAPAAPAASSASQPAPSTPASSSSGTSGGVSYSATFTEYGSGDDVGSPNCNDATVSCGWYSFPGYFAAVSQNLFGAASGAGSACGSCWQLDPVSNPNNNADPTAPVAGMNSIVVMVNNLCPSDSNERDCGQTTLSDTNFAGANVNFDLCIDDGAANALFGSSGIGMAFGKATAVSCDLWTGSHTNITSLADIMPSEPNAGPS